MWDCFLAGDHVPRNHRPSVEILTTTGLCNVGRRPDHRRSARRGSEEKQEQRPSAIVTVHFRFNGHMRRRGWTIILPIQTRSTRSGRGLAVGISFYFTVSQEIRCLAPLAAR